MHHFILCAYGCACCARRVSVHGALVGGCPFDRLRIQPPVAGTALFDWFNEADKQLILHGPYTFRVLEAPLQNPKDQIHPPLKALMNTLRGIDDPGASCLLHLCAHYSYSKQFHTARCAVTCACRFRSHHSGMCAASAVTLTCAPIAWRARALRTTLIRLICDTHPSRTHMHMPQVCVLYMAL